MKQPEMLIKQLHVLVLARRSVLLLCVCGPVGSSQTVAAQFDAESCKMIMLDLTCHLHGRLQCCHNLLINKLPGIITVRHLQEF